MSGARSRSLWWAAGSLVAVVVGTFGPWVKEYGLAVDGSDDEFVGIAALIAGIALVVFAVTRSRPLAIVPLLAGLIAATLIGHNLTDPAGPFWGPGPNIHLQWGIWAALAGSIGLALASMVLLTGGITMRGARLAPGGRRRGPARTRRRRDPWEARVSEFWALARSLTPYVAAEQRDGVFIVPTLAKRKFFAQNVSRESTILDRAVDVLGRHGRSVQSSTIIDVGAHTGTTSIAALAQHGFERAVAIEPDPDNLRLLRANIALNGLHEQVTVIEGAVSDSAGVRPFEPGPRQGADAAFLWMKGRLAADPSPGSFDVETFTLDTLCDAGVVDPATTGLAWLDCQKEEEQALLSASAFFEHRVPIVFVLRPRRSPRFSPLAHALAAAYEFVVDLRRSGPRSNGHWTPVVRPIDELVSLGNRKVLTDVVVF